MYLTYDEYKEMGGTLDVATFSDLAFQACAIIDWYTFNRLQKETEIPQNVKMLVMQLIKFAQLQNDVLFGKSSTDGAQQKSDSFGTVASQSNDGFSVSYNILSASDILKLSDTQSSKVRSMIDLYLHGVVNSLGRQLLYRGLYPGE